MLIAGLATVLVLGVAPFADRVDAYPRQPLDVEHYSFALQLSDSTDRIAGEATVRIRVLPPGLSTVVLDLATTTAERQGRGMRVNSVRRSGRELVFAHAADRLTITLDSAGKAGDVIELVVRYAGVPADGLQIGPNKYGERGFFSDNWPDKARQWLPLIDHISDKATMDMDVVAPAHYQVISNGRRVEHTDLPGGQRRTSWRESVPIAPWLYVLGVAHFAVQQLGDFQGVPLETWVFAQDREAGFADFASPSREVLAFYSAFVGPYAYEKLANVQSNSVSGGMEAASAIFYSSQSVTGTRSLRWRNVVIHEIAHQWFGNAVTESDWNDVWLSEGFATYFTLLFIEHAYGRDEFVAGLRDSRRTVLSADDKTPGYRVVHANLTDMSQVTSAMTYQKGSFILHMLRQEMGDDRFWLGIREYYARFRNGSATTTDFRQVMERAAGRSFAPFFEQWLYRGGIPRLEGTWHWDRTAGQVIVELRQTQAGEPFMIPVEFGIVETAGPSRVVQGELKGRDGTFTFAAPVEPASVEPDPNVRLLASWTLARK